tara:strand:- start:65 stop:307 length:243 start_codon:yes stop_codon:yes gene_type:complete
MKKSASEVITELEARIAKLERQASVDTSFYIQAIEDISRGLDDLGVIKTEKEVLEKINKRDLDKVLAVSRELKNLYKALI